MTVDDGKRFLNIYGKQIVKLKGCKTRQKSLSIKDMVMVPLSKTLGGNTQHRVIIDGLFICTRDTVSS